MWDLLTSAFKSSGWKLAAIAAMGAGIYYAYHELKEDHYQRGYNEAKSFYEEQLKEQAEASAGAVTVINKRLETHRKEAARHEAAALEWYEMWLDESEKEPRTVYVDKIKKIKIPGECNNLGDDFNRLRREIWKATN